MSKVVVTVASMEPSGDYAFYVDGKLAGKYIDNGATLVTRVLKALDVEARVDGPIVIAEATDNLSDVEEV